MVTKHTLRLMPEMRQMIYRLLFGSDIWTKHRGQFFSLLGCLSTVCAAPMTWSRLQDWLFGIYLRNVPNSVACTLEKNSSLTKYTLISKVPSHLIDSLHCRILLKPKNRDVVQLRNRRTMMVLKKKKKMDFLVQMGTWLIIDFRKESEAFYRTL